MKMHFRIYALQLVCAVNLVAAFGGSEEKFIKKYAMMKVYESCFGAQVLNEIRREMKEAAQKCSGLQLNFDDKYFTKDGNNIKQVPNPDWTQEPPQRLKPSLGTKVKKPIHTTDTLLLQQWTEEQKQTNSGSSTSVDQDHSETESATEGEIDTTVSVKKPVDFSKLEEAIMNIGKPPVRIFRSKTQYCLDVTPKSHFGELNEVDTEAIEMNEFGSLGIQKHGSTNSNFQQTAAVGYYPAMYYPPPIPFAPSYPYHAYYPNYFQTPGPAGSAAFQSFYRSGLRAAKITNFNSRNRKQTDMKSQMDFAAFQSSSKIKNISCIMQELGYLDEHLEPNYSRMTDRINRLYIPEELKRDMLEGVKFCRQFSQCVPDTRKDSFQLSKELLRPMFFFRCYKHKKLESCIMKDIRERFSQTADLNNDVRRSFRNNDIVGTIFESAFGPGFDDYESLP